MSSKLSKITLNGYEAIWNVIPEGLNAGTLDWIQDGIRVTFMPNNLSMDYLIKIAESAEHQDVRIKFFQAVRLDIQMSPVGARIARPRTANGRPYRALQGGT
ncbi:MAG: DUF4367 domain-containing protein [Clostridiales bacterium]|jgi:hypothetical protein|nr:DUF4367 domain-containing protein [Clostridiales bacterium]